MTRARIKEHVAESVSGQGGRKDPIPRPTLLQDKRSVQRQGQPVAH